MVKRKNYDSPFEKEDFKIMDHQPILENEYHQNTEFTDEFYDYVPNHIMPSYPMYLWQSSFLTNIQDEENESYQKYKDIEGLE